MSLDFAIGLGGKTAEVATMSEDIVKIKGTRAGLQLSFASGAKFEEIKSNIVGKLESGSNFFIRGTTVYIPRETFPTDQMEVLRRIFHRHGMLFRNDMPKPKLPVTPAPKKIVEPKKPQETRMLVINRTVRSGQEIRTDNSVLICGNVNPGAQVIAGGSIDIRGTCRGLVHAGAFGDTKAVIIADRLMPVQIRIANLVARSPDETEKVDMPERASIKNSQIVIEPIMR